MFEQTVFSFSHTFFQVSINCLESMNIIDCVFGQLCDTYKRSLLFRFSLNAVEIWNESKNVLSLNETPVFSVHEIATHAHARAHPSHSWRSLRRKMSRWKMCVQCTQNIHVVNGEMVFNTITVQVRVRVWDRILCKRKWPIYILMVIFELVQRYIHITSTNKYITHQSKLENGSFDSHIKCIEWLCCRQQWWQF